MSLTIGCLSEGKLFITRPGEAETEIKSAFVDSLRDRLQSIKNRREWKSSGTGAQFARRGLPIATGDFEVDRFQARFSAVCPSPEAGRILYAIDAGDVHGIFSYHVQQQLNKNQPEEALSAVPRSWVLKRRLTGAAIYAAETVASGVMAYTVAADDTVFYSNGRGVFSLAPGSRSPQKLSGRPLVTCLFAARE